MQGGILKALETCSGGQAGGVSAQDSGHTLFGMLHECRCDWQAVGIPLSKARKSSPIWQKPFEVGILHKRAKPGPKEGHPLCSGQELRWHIGGDGSEAYLVHRRRQKRSLPALRGCSSHFLIGVA